ncbi:MAG: hypothetical protein A3D31_03080 [Candidatus Fluviicola riflensis]|nr:MAG: hypothetical protein A3D31_03080 [Candidatus Fluviicola riflensis]OGS85992.1 MAG: hypothetical protein A3E30_10565 [Fluviicola sp. RIFCSPHIGHO2_12_FULL_43_24]OGS86401.1 MAG: hypothetical protein A2724_02535 [Fluviicola sp. RIFCSPHIGHO2_01_FULL_43_53]
MHYFSLVLAVCCSFFTTGIYSQSLVQISGQLEDIHSEPIMLAYYLGDKQYIEDTVEIDANGKFIFTYPELLEQGVYLFYFPGNSRYVEFILGDDQQFSVKGKLSDFTKTAKFSGSTDNTLFYGYLNKLETFKEKDEKWSAVKSRHTLNGNADSLKVADEMIQQNGDAYKVYKKQFLEKNANSFLEKLLRFNERPDVPETLTQEEKYYYYKNHIFDNLDWSFDGVLRSPNYESLLTEFIDKLTPQTPDSIIIACDLILQKTKENDDLFKYTLIQLTNKYARSTTICFDAIYVHLVENYYLKGQAFWLNGTDEESKVQLKKMKENAERLKPVLCGNYAYNFTLADEKGKKHELRKISGERTILLFWASDCHRCEAFMKELAAITDLCEKKGVTIVSVDNGADGKLWREKLEKYPVKNMLALTSSGSEEQTLLIEQFDLYSTPLAFFLDKDKKILYKKLDVEQIKNIVERLPDVSE